ncbi:MAG TPA: hypothetical protein VGC60_17540 [Pyrinomonadaceae bacterium]
MSRRNIRMFTILVISLIGAVMVSGQANKSQAKPDLSGAWRLDSGRSNIGKSRAASNEEIRITHLDPELKIFTTIVVNGQPDQREFTYYTDGRGETNPATVWLSTNPQAKPSHPPETASKTKWNGEKIVTRYTIRLIAGTHVVEEEVVEEWKLSVDGQTLTQSRRFVMRGDREPGSVFIPSDRPDDKRVYNLLSK